MPIPGSAEPCKRCGAFVIVGDPDTVPAWKLTGNKRSRGFYHRACAEKLGLRPRAGAPRPVA